MSHVQMQLISLIDHYSRPNMSRGVLGMGSPLTGHRVVSTRGTGPFPLVLRGPQTGAEILTGSAVPCHKASPRHAVVLRQVRKATRGVHGRFKITIVGAKCTVSQYGVI